MGAFQARPRRHDQHYDLLPPEQRRAERSVQRPEVVDADFVVIRDASLRPRGSGMPQNDNNRLSARKRSSAVLGVVREVAVSVAMAAERALRKVPARRFPVIVAAASISVFALAGGFAAIAGASAPPAAPAALALTHVNLTPQDANGMRVLLLTAIIENRTGATRTLSPIRADLVSGGRLLTRTMIAPPAADLEPGHSRGISMRLPHPGGKMPEVRLSFTDMDVSIR